MEDFWLGFEKRAGDVIDITRHLAKKVKRLRSPGQASQRASHNARILTDNKLQAQVTSPTMRLIVADAVAAHKKTESAPVIKKPGNLLATIFSKLEKLKR